MDQSTKTTSYTALPGEFTANAIEISNPTNDVKSNIYTLKFTLSDSVPSAGYIQVDLPSVVKLNPSTTLSTASCRVLTCLDAQENGLRFLITDSDLVAGTEMELQIGGAINPRSFKPSDPIIVTTLDTDGQS